MSKDQARRIRKEKKRKEHIQKSKILKASQNKVTTLDKITGKKNLYIIVAMAFVASALIFYTLRF